MTRPATITKAEIERAAIAAARIGYAVTVDFRAGIVRLEPLSDRPAPAQGGGDVEQWFEGQ